MLISTILRQYFLSLKVLGKWPMWGPSMENQWGRVQQRLHRTHSVVEPRRQATPSSPAALAEGLQAMAVQSRPQVPRLSPGVPARSRSRSPAGRLSGTETPLDESADALELEQDSRPPRDAAPLAALPAPTPLTHRERELQIMRRVMRKWWRLTGLAGHPNLCETLGEGEFRVDWTKAIAPRIEGRIREAAS